MAKNNPNITIQFEAKGHKPLIDALKELNRQQKKLGNAVRGTGNAVKNFGQRVDKATKTAKEQSSAINSLNANIAIYRNRILLAAFAIGMYSKTIGRLTSLYAQQELAEKKLSTALGGTSKALLDFASAQQQVTVFGDEVTIQAMAQIAAFTKNEESIKKITVGSQDLASGLGIDLNSAVTQLTKSIFSNTNALSRQGVEIDNSLKGQERLEAILKRINELYGGQAAAEVETYSGATKQLANTYGDLGENIGKTLGEALLPVIKAMTSFGELLKQIDPRILTNALAALAVAVLLNSKRFKTLTKSLFGVEEGMTKTAVATKALRGAFSVLAKSAGIFLVLEATQELFKMFSSPLVAKSEQNVQNISTSLSQFDQDLIAVSRSLPKSIELANKAQSEFDKALQSAEDALLDTHSGKQKEFAKGILQAYVGFEAFQAGHFETGFNLIKDATEDNKKAIEENNEALKIYNDLIEGTAVESENLKNANAQVKSIQQEQLKLLNDLVPKLKKENQQLELKLLFTGRELELEQARAIIRNSDVAIGKDIIKQIEDEINRKHDLIDAMKEEKDALKIVNKERDKYNKMLENIKPLSEYGKLLKSKTDILKDGLDIMKNENISDKDKLEITKKQSEVIKELNKQIKELKSQGLDVVFKKDEDAIKKSKKEISDLNEEIKQYNLSQRSELEVLKDKQKVYKEHFATLPKGTEAYKETEKALKNLKDEIDDATPLNAFEEVIEQIIEKNKELEASFISEKDALTLFVAELDSMLASLKEQSEENEDILVFYETLLRLTNKLKGNIERSTDEFGYFGQIGVDVLNGLNSAIVATLVEFDKINKITWDTFGDNVASVMKRIAAEAIATGFFKVLAMILDLQGGGIGTSMLNLMDIKHQGGEVQGYATGGLIPMQGYNSGGSINSGIDNVPIMAQEGEFVMRRSAVESIGVENLNRMNRTGQATGGVNITFSGNVMSRDFIEEEAIPQIKDAIRRGADIGIS